MPNNISTNANNLLAKELLGVNSNIDTSNIGILILKEKINTKKLLCKIV